MHTSHQPLARGPRTQFDFQNFSICSEGKSFNQNLSGQAWQIPAWAWLQILGPSVNRRMFHVAANYNHNILHPMYLVTTLCPRLLLNNIISPFSHRDENINSLGSRFSFSRPFWDLWVSTSHLGLGLNLHNITIFIIQRQLEFVTR